MLTAIRSNTEVTALAVVTFLIIGLVGFISLDDDEGFDFDVTEEVGVVEEAETELPEAAALLEEQKRREAAGLPTGSKKKVDRRSHQHGGYGTTFRVVDATTKTGVSNAIVYFLPQKSVSEIDWTWRREEVVRTQGMAKRERPSLTHFQR